MLYHIYEFNHSVLKPLRAIAQYCEIYYRNPFNPLSYTLFGKTSAAMFEMFERLTRRYGKPSFQITAVMHGDMTVPVHEKIIWSQSFCNLLHFCKELPDHLDPGPKLLIIAPLSGHYATLLRGTVETMLPHHDVYITDWIDARVVPLIYGRFDLDDYIDYLITMLHVLGPSTHLLAVCQPSVPAICAAALMDSAEDPNTPTSMTLIGGPIDTRENPTKVNEMTQQRSIEWFRKNTIVPVPWPNFGFMRQVYPGFLQLTGFMSMNLDRHVTAHQDLFSHLVQGDEDSAEKKSRFYDEYLAVMDLTAEFYLQTIKTVFIDHDLPRGTMKHREIPVDLTKIHRVALLTIEGEQDDISGVGQTRAAHKLCVNIPQDMRQHHLQKDVGHYGSFNGSRFRNEIAPVIRQFIARFDTRLPSTPVASPSPQKTPEPPIQTE